MLTARSSRFDALSRNHQHQFGAISFGVGGIGIPAFGSTGLGGIRGGFGAGASAGGGSGIGPVITLEGAFGVGFTAQDIADQIRQAEQDGTLQSGQAFEVATGPALRMVLDLAKGLFEIFDITTGQKVGGGVTPEAAIAAVNLGGGVTGGGQGGAVLEPPTFPAHTRGGHRRRFPGAGGDRL